MTIRDEGSTALYTAYTVYTAQIALLCLNSSMYAYILLEKVRTLLERTDGFLSKMLEVWTG